MGTQRDYLVWALAVASSTIGACSSKEDSPGPDAGADVVLTGPVACHWDQAEPLVVADLSAPGAMGPTLDSRMALHAVGRSSARVVVTRTDADATQVFTIDIKARKVATSALPKKLMNTGRVTGGFGVLVAETDGGLGFYRVPDDAPDPAGVAPESIARPTGDAPFQAAFSELAPGRYFFVASYTKPGSTPTAYDYYGGAAGNGATYQGLFDTTENGRLGPMFVIPTGNDVYAFLGNDPANPVRIYKLPTATAPAKTSSFTIGGMNGGVTLSGGLSKSAPGKVDLLGATVSASIEATLYTAQVETSGLENIIVAEPQFKKLGTYGASDVQGNSGTTRFFDDDWVAVGIGVIPRGGINFAWVNTRGETVVTAGGDNRLVNGRSISGSAIDLEERVGDHAAVFGVTWKEEVAAPSPHDVVYFNELVCGPT